MKNFTGKCCCGFIEFECEGNPLFTQYCHCNKCRELASLSSCDNDKQGYACTAAYLTKNFHITKGQDDLEVLERNHAEIFICSACKSVIYGISLDPKLQAGIGVNANNFAEDIMAHSEPVRHIYYDNRIVDVDDDLPKFKDAPKEQGGSGELCR